MRFPRPPDWLIYAAVVGGLLYLALSRQEHVVPPPAPAPVREAEGAIIGPASPFDPAVTVDVPDHPSPSAGTAFSVASTGLWITARHVVDGCRQAARMAGATPNSRMSSGVISEPPPTPVRPTMVPTTSPESV